MIDYVNERHAESLKLILLWKAIAYPSAQRIQRNGKHKKAKQVPQVRG